MIKLGPKKVFITFINGYNDIKTFKKKHKKITVIRSHLIKISMELETRKEFLIIFNRQSKIIKVGFKIKVRFHCILVYTSKRII